MKTNFNESSLRDTKDNWLAQELAYERKLSVWRLDDSASFLDQEHKEQCEAKAIKQAHHDIHQTVDNYNGNRSTTTIGSLNNSYNNRGASQQRSANRKYSNPNQNQTAGAMITIVFLIYFIFMFLSAILSIF